MGLAKDDSRIDSAFLIDFRGVSLPIVPTEIEEGQAR